MADPCEGGSINTEAPRQAADGLLYFSSSLLRSPGWAKRAACEDRARLGISPLGQELPYRSLPDHNCFGPATDLCSAAKRDRNPERWTFNSAHFHGTCVPVEEPSTASIANMRCP